MITAVLSVLAALWICGVIILIVAARRAPVGFEDADGFHAEKPPSRRDPVIATTLRAH